MSVHDRPSAAELVEAVRELFERELLDALEGRLRFHARVAVNVLGIVERELRSGAEDDAAARQALSELLGRDGAVDDLLAELAAAIRAGDLDDDPRVAGVVRSIVRRKVDVARPGYTDDE